MIMNIQLTFTLQYLKSMMDSHNLSLENHSKPVCSSVDLHSLLMYNWCFYREGIAHERYRVQTTLLCQIMAYTSTRPGALIESSCYRGINESLRWKNVKLKLIKSSPSDFFVVELETTLIKGKRKMVEPIIFMLMDVPTNPIFCPILPLIALAFADDAFANEGIRTPADLFRLRVEDPGKNHLEVPWKASILDTPVFRSVEPGKSYISTTTSLKYADSDYRLRRLGMFAGFPDGVRSYGLRRGAASAIDNPEVTVAQRMQIVGHAREDVFKHYIHRTVQVDTQAAFLGNPSQRELVAGISRMGASRGANAPTSLTAEQCAEVNSDPRLIALRLEKSGLLSQIKAKHQYMKDAAGTDLHKQYVNKDENQRALRRKLEKGVLKESREAYFRDIHYNKINRQLAGDDIKLPLTTERPTFRLAERTRIADTMLGHVEFSRQHVVDDMVRLCVEGERLPSRMHNEQLASYETKLWCGFCIGQGSRTSYRQFASTGFLKTHIHQFHLAALDPGRPACPYPLCIEVLDGIENFKNHFATVHGVNL